MSDQLNKRVEGFAGQHLFIVPEGVVGESADHPLLRGLCVTDAGYFPQAEGHEMVRGEGAAGAILIVCRAGRGWLRLDPEAQRPIGPGDVILIGKGQPHCYGSDREHPWSIQWAHFIGEEVPHWWKWLGLPQAGGVLSLPAGSAGQLNLGRVHESLGVRAQALVAASSALRWTLASLVRARVGGTEPASSREAVVRVEDWMREHSANKVSLPELAARAGLSQPHFAMLFKRIYGQSPIEHFIRLKMQRACGLLRETNWPIKRIAEEVSVPDPLYFSRIFRRVVGCSPTRWRD